MKQRKSPMVATGRRTPGVREVALEILVQQEQSRRPLDQVLAEYHASRLPADPRDRQLVLALVYEVLRWRGFLDELAARYSRHPLSKMKSLTLHAIRLGMVQLLFFDRIPPAAAIDETIKALKAARQPSWLTGFVNGLLRNVARSRDELREEQERDADLLSHPAWLRERWRRQLGEELARQRCRANNAPPPLVLRVNLRRTTPADLQSRLVAQGLAVLAGRYASAALVLPDYHGRIENLPGYGEGHFAVQDEAAQLVTLLLTPEADEQELPQAESGAGAPRSGAKPLYLDACAGLGGKTGHLAELLPPTATLTALEPNVTRFALLVANLTRLGVQVEGAERITPVTASSAPLIHLRAGTLAELARSADFAAGLAPFTGILVDAPCSGLGVIRRHPDIRWNRQAADLARYRGQQRDLLQTAAALLAPGGLLVFVVCSNEPEENEELIAEVLQASPALAVSDARGCLPVAARELVDEQGFFRSRPEAGLDGFFAARLRKRDA